MILVEAGLKHEPVPNSALLLAGKVFQKYRKSHCHLFGLARHYRRIPPGPVLDTEENAGLLRLDNLLGKALLLGGQLRRSRRDAELPLAFTASETLIGTGGSTVPRMTGPRMTGEVSIFTLAAPRQAMMRVSRFPPPAMRRSRTSKRTCST